MSRHIYTSRERFLMRVQIPDDPMACWGWKGARTQKGWGKFRLHPGPGGTMAVGRASWRLHVGDIPHGMNVLHKCDNGLCGNPDHLFLGTHLDNMRDMASKGRSGRRAGMARHMTSTGSGTLAHIRIGGVLHRQHFRHGTTPETIQQWLTSIRRRYDRRFTEHDASSQTTPTL